MRANFSEEQIRRAAGLYPDLAPYEIEQHEEGWRPVIRLGAIPPRPNNDVEYAPSSTDDEVSASSQFRCVVCFENQREILFLPCRHVVVCRACNSRLRECCLCRREIIGVYYVFL